MGGRFGNRGRHKKVSGAAYRLKHHCLLFNGEDADMDEYHESGQYERDLRLVVSVVQWHSVLQSWEQRPIEEAEGRHQQAVGQPDS